MKHGKAKWGFIVVGGVAVLALGAIGVAGAAGNDSTATPAPSSPAQPGQGYCFDGDGDGPHDGILKEGGPGDLAEALANLSGKDEATIMQQRAAGKSFAELAESYGVSESDLIAEATKIETAELDAAVKAGQITEAQRAEILSGLKAHLEEEIAETHAIGGPGGHGDGRFGDAGGDASGATGGETAAPNAKTSYLTY
jgi:hypothetical protein